MFMGQRTDQPSPAHRTAVLPGDLPGLADQVVSWCCRSNPQRSRHYVGIYQAVRGVWCFAVLVSSECVLCGPANAMWVPGSEVRESAHAAQLGSLGAWGPGPWVVPSVGLNKGPSGEREAAGTLSLRCLLLSRLSHR